MKLFNQGLTSFQLKVLGITLMVVDHIHQMFYFVGVPLWFTMIGRLVAPIFLFLSVEGFTHTCSKKRYMTTLLIGYWICQILFSGVAILFPNEQVVLLNSIFGTLFLGVFLMWIWDNLFGKDRRIGKGIMGLIAFVIMTLFPLVALNWTNILILLRLIFLIPSPFIVEGGFVMIGMAVLIYIFRSKRWLQLAVIALVALVTYIVNPTDIQWMMVFSIIPLALYNGHEGRKEKWFFYIFYPVHIVVLYLISTLMI